MNEIKPLLNQLGNSKTEKEINIESQLKKYYIDPFYISNSNSLNDKNYLKIEARIVSDAFEAVTNGMHSNETISQLGKIEDSSFFSDWKYLTESLYYIYTNSFENAEIALKKIQENSVPSLLLPVIKAIMQANQDISACSETGISFIREILNENIILRENINNAALYLQNREEHYFIDTVTLIMTDTFSKKDYISKNVAIWAIKQLFSFDISPELLIENMKLIFGEAETLRLSAVAFIEEDQELSLLFWMKALLSLLKKNCIDKVTIEAYIEIIEELSKKISNYDIDSVILKQIQNLFVALNSEFKLKYQGTFILKNIQNIVENEKDNPVLGLPITASSLINNKKADILNNKKSVQLELFA